MNSKLEGTTMSKISFEGVVALKRAGLVSMFQTVYSAHLQEKADNQMFHYLDLNKSLENMCTNVIRRIYNL